MKYPHRELNGAMINGNGVTMEKSYGAEVLMWRKEKQVRLGYMPLTWGSRKNGLGANSVHMHWYYRVYDVKKTVTKLVPTTQWAKGNGHAMWNNICIGGCDVTGSSIPGHL